MSDSQFKDIVRYGVYYFPATTHYARPCVVVCDRCNKTNLSVCIGYNNLDLCMQCVEKVAKDINTPSDQTIVDNSPDYRVRMMPAKFYEELHERKRKRERENKKKDNS